MRAVALERIPYGRVVLQQPQGKRTFACMTKADGGGASCCALNICPAKDAADTGMGILQIWGRVAVKRQHALPVEHIIFHAITGEVGILDCPDADHPRDHVALRFGQFWVFLSDRRRGTLHCFV